MKFDVRLQMVQQAADYGVKPTARRWGCEPKTVRKWLVRWKQAHHARAALQDRSRAPKSCPHRTPPRVEAQILRERQKAPCLGARRLKLFCAIPAGVGAIARILRQHGLTRKRKKKYQKKRDMRELKARFKPFEQLQVDAKYLTDIPYYVEQLWRHGDLPRYQYTCRDVKTGAVFLGFAKYLGEVYACCFIAAVAAHLKRTGHRLQDFATIQTDNGAEFSGQERKLKDDRGFHWLVEQKIGAHHRYIPVGRKNYQADVESFHERIETEFFDQQRFADRADFFTQAGQYQLWWNAVRQNTWKRFRSPDQILLEEKPDRNPGLWRLPALDLDRLLTLRAADGPQGPYTLSGGYYVPALPETNQGG